MLHVERELERARRALAIDGDLASQGNGSQGSQRERLGYLSARGGNRQPRRLPLRVDEDERRLRERRVPIAGGARQAQRPFEPRIIVADELGEIARGGRVDTRGALCEQDRGLALL